MSAPHLARNLQLVEERAASVIRAQRIDALTVDHAAAGRGIPGLTSPAPWPCTESDRELRCRLVRADITIAERIAAWAVLFALPQVEK